MSVNIQHKILQYEMPPPAGTWENIASRLDEEFDVADTKFSEKLFDAGLEPPTLVWQNIVAELDQPVQEEKQPARVVSIFTWRKMAAAAVIIGLVIAGAWFFRHSDSIPEMATTKTNPPSGIPDVDIASAGIAASDDISSAIAQIIPRKVRVRDQSAVRHTAFIARPVKNEDDNYQAEARTVHVQPVQLADATTDAVVAAPLLRDANGNIIMDMSLLTSSSSGNYITVTGPNGEQTRISTKFANFLAYLNNSSSSDKEEYLDYLIRNSGAWKKRFDEWRNKILQYANFSPSGSTFFDILELKELIKD